MATLLTHQLPFGVVAGWVRDRPLVLTEEDLRCLSARGATAEEVELLRRVSGEPPLRADRSCAELVELVERHGVRVAGYELRLSGQDAAAVTVACVDVLGTETTFAVGRAWIELPEPGSLRDLPVPELDARPRTAAPPAP